MKNPDAVLRELAQLYDFQRELAKFRFKKKPKSNKTAAPDPNIHASKPRGGGHIVASDSRPRTDATYIFSHPRRGRG